MAEQTHSPIVYVYTSCGEIGAFLQFPYLYSRQGEWIGWVAADRQVYSVHGHCVGWLSNDPRVLRKRSSDFLAGRRKPPRTPPPILPPSRLPLAPMLPELPVGMMDVLEEAPDLLPSLDAGDLKDDLE